MAFYEEKVKAQRAIEAHISEGKTKEQIYYYVSRDFGFGRSFVDKYLELKNKAIESARIKEMEEQGNGSRDKTD